MIFMHHKIKSFPVAVISTRAITAAVHPSRASAQRNCHSQKQFFVLFSFYFLFWSKLLPLQRKCKVLAIQAFFASIKINALKPTSPRGRYVHCVLPLCEMKNPFVSSVIRPPHSHSKHTHCPGCHLSFSCVRCHCFGSLRDAGKKH